MFQAVLAQVEVSRPSYKLLNRMMCEIRTCLPNGGSSVCVLSLFLLPVPQSVAQPFTFL